MKITSRLLRSKGACSEQVELFKALGGDKKPLTLALCVKYASKFDWDWASANLFTAPVRAEYQKAIALAWEEYEKAKAPAWAEYEKAIAPAWAEYQKAIAPVRAEYEKAKAPAWAEYEKATAPVRAEYQKAKASAFYHAWKLEN